MTFDKLFMMKKKKQEKIISFGKPLVGEEMHTTTTIQVFQVMKKFSKNKKLGSIL
jgi:hypothetical protein